MGGRGAGEKRAKHEVGARVPLYRMFAFADRTDAALMAVGVVTAVASGMAQPIMTFVLGDVINAFSSAGSSPDMVHRVTKLRLGLASGQRS